MKSFCVESRAENPRKHRVLEASAGTGKTYSIEHIVLRLLVESEEHDPWRLKDILLVTFTKLAARELRERVRAALARSLTELQRGEAKQDFLQAILEQSEDKRKAAIRVLKAALLRFDEAQIFTIHGFCYRLLKEHSFTSALPLFSSEGEGAVAQELTKGIIYDLFRTELSEDLITAKQLEILLKSYRGAADKLAEALSQSAMRPVPIQAYPSAREGYRALEAVWSALAEKGPLVAEKIEADFTRLSPQYKGLANRSGELHEAVRSRVAQCAEDVATQPFSPEIFDRLIECGCPFIDLLAPAKRKSKAKELDPSTLCYPDLLEFLSQKLGPVLKELRSPDCLFAAVAGRFQERFAQLIREREIWGPDQLLKAMDRASRDGAFGASLRARYRAVIIDEFQDTDPLQWGIFERLFLKKDQQTPYLYLVGDPKQSIYAFRNADIYTYLRAVQCLGENAVASLDTNYRSHPAMVQALNTLFSLTDPFMDLPKLGEGLQYQAVRAGRAESEDGPALHFFTAQAEMGRKKQWPTTEMEDALFFPFIAREVQKLVEGKTSAYSDCAVLVRDRYQASRLAQFFRGLSIPYVLRRSQSLLKGEALSRVKELLGALAQLRDPSAVKVALGGRFFGWTAEKLQGADDLSSALALLTHLKERLYTFGVAGLMEALLASKQKGSALCLGERLLRQEGGEDFLQEVLQLFQLLIDRQPAGKLSPTHVLSEIEILEQSDPQDSAFQVQQDRSRDAVQILTLHVSKGLEYKVVFALGVINRSPVQEGFVSEGSSQHVVEKGSPGHKAYCQELDAEKLRQLYVALTRAREHLYIPVALQKDLKKPPELGTASPLELFLARVGKDIPYLEQYERMVSLEETNLPIIKEALLGAAVCWHDLSESSPQVAPIAPPKGVQLIQPRPIRVSAPDLCVHSFSSLTRPLSHGSMSEVPPRDFLVEEKNAHTLPAGAEVGTILHEVLEKAAFSRFRTEDPASLVCPWLKGGLLEGWEGVVGEMLKAVCLAPIVADDPAFCLADLNPASAIQELEFLFPYSFEGFELEDIQVHPGFVTGFIDLIFEHRDKLYILDWKSNWVGPSSNAYNPESLGAVMRTHYYPLQAALYQAALKRYVLETEGQAPPARFGGAIYVFLRGRERGIWAFNPKELE